MFNIEQPSQKPAPTKEKQEKKEQLSSAAKGIRKVLSEKPAESLEEKNDIERILGEMLLTPNSKESQQKFLKFTKRIQSEGTNFLKDHQVEDLIAFCRESKRTNFFRILKLIEQDKIKEFDLTLKAKRILLEHFGQTGMEKGLESIFKNALTDHKSIQRWIAAAREYKNALGLILKNTPKETFYKFTGYSLEVLVRSLGAREVGEKLDTYQKIILLGQDISRLAKLTFYQDILKKVDINTLSPEVLPIVINCAIDTAQLQSITSRLNEKGAKNISNINYGILKKLLREITADQKNSRLFTLITENMSESTIKKLLKDKGVEPAVKLALSTQTLAKGGAEAEAGEKPKSAPKLKAKPPKSPFLDALYTKETIAKGKFNLKRNVKVYGHDKTQPQLYRSFTKKDHTAEITDNRVISVADGKYVKVEIKDKDSKTVTTGLVALRDLIIPKTETTYYTPPKVEKEEKRLKRKECWNMATGKIQFRNMDGSLDRKAQYQTRLRDIFDAKESDQITVTNKRGKTREAIFDSRKNGFYYLGRKGQLTGRRVMIFDGDKVDYTTRKIDKAKRETFKSKVWNESTGKIQFTDKTTAARTRLRDIFYAQDGDRVMITHGKDKPRTAIYVSSKDNFYYLKKNGKLGERARIFNNDRVIFLGREEKTPETKTPSKYDIAGRFELPKTKTSAAEILKSIFKKHPELKTALSQSDLTEEQYYNLLIGNKQGNTLLLIKPPKSHRKEQARLKKEAQKRKENLEGQKKTKEYDVLALSDHYIKKTVIFNNPKLLKYFNKQELWNNLWGKKGEQAKEYIDGLEKVIAVLTDPLSFNLTKDQVRDTLLKLVQKHRNDRIDFEDIFTVIFENKLYKGSLSDFKKEIDKHKKVFFKWESPEKKADLKALKEYGKTFKQAKLAMETAKEQGRDFRETPEWKAWNAMKPKMYPIQRAYADEYLPSLERINELTRTILKPTANLLDAVEAMKIKVSSKESFIDIYDFRLGSTPETNLKETLLHTKKDIMKFDLESLATQTSVEGKYKLRVSTTLTDPYLEKLSKVLQRRDLITIVFQLYSIDTLLKEGCLKRVKGEKDTLALVKLPKTFDPQDPKIKELFAKFISRKEVERQKDKIKSLAENIDGNKVVLKKLNEIFGSEGGPKTYHTFMEEFASWFTGDDTRAVELTMSEIAGGKVTLPAKEYLKRYMSGNAAKKEVLSKISKYSNGVETFDRNLLRNELQKKLTIALDSLKLLSFKNPAVKALATTILRPFSGGKDIFSEATISAAHKGLSQELKQYLDNPSENIDTAFKSLLMLGHVQSRVIEEGKEKFNYSSNPIIAKLQKAYMEKTDVYTQKDLDTINRTLTIALGLSVGTEGKIGAFGGGNINLGDGWSAGVHFEGSTSGITAGAQVLKSFNLSKDGKEKFTVGSAGGFVHIGGIVNLQLGKKAVQTSLSAGGGISALGFYAGGGLSLKDNLQYRKQKAL
ncbi:MAG: hypothetical protein V1679_01865, partial [Candidatus Peregrinibacteria bacterium]